MRIVAGHLGGRRLVAPSGRDTRPTSDRVREATFAALGSVEGLEVLDLFAGSGAMALEALSRGATAAVCVDFDAEAVGAIRRNVEALGVDALTVHREDWRSALRRLARDGRRFGLCVLDPPYSLLPRIARELGQELAPVLAEGALVVVEESAQDDPVDLGLAPAVQRERRYGGTRISIIRMGESE